MDQDSYCEQPHRTPTIEDLCWYDHLKTQPDAKALFAIASGGDPDEANALFDTIHDAAFGGKAVNALTMYELGLMSMCAFTHPVEEAPKPRVQAEYLWAKEEIADARQKLPCAKGIELMRETGIPVRKPRHCTRPSVTLDR